MQSAGRGDDSVLIHMTPGEVNGLQSLAVKHGGSLTINPNTGLPEAGFLSSLLPMVIGGALTVMSGGALSPLMAAAMTGGGYTLATGSLKKGLMAGLGAYGGAGLGTSLSALGAGAGAVTPTLNGSIMGGAAGTTSAGPLSTFGSGLYNAAPNIAANSFTAAAPTQLTAASQALQIPTAAAAPTYANMGRGLQSLNSLDALKTFGGNNMMSIGAAAAPMMMPEQFKPPKQDQGMIRPYTLDRTQNPQAYAQSTDAQGRTNTPVYGQPFDSSERSYFNDKYTAGTPYAAPGPEYKATGGLTALAVGGPVEEMSAQNAMGQNTGYPMANLQSPMYTNPQMQRPMAGNVVNASGDVGVNPYTGEQKFAEGGTTAGGYKYTFNPQTQAFTRTGSAPVTTPQSTFNNGLIGGVVQKAVTAPDEAPQTTGGVATPYVQPAAPQYTNHQQAPQAQQPMQHQDNMQGFYDYMRNQMNGMQGYAAGGGISDLGSYSDGGRLLKGPGDGVSDSIPAQIGDNQPARLADGEFVVPARIVSELGNGSTEAGARQLYKMMERVQHNRRKSVGKDKVAVDAKSAKFLPA